MRRQLRLGVPALGMLVLATSACGRDGTFISTYGGDPYTGLVRVVVKSDAASGGSRRSRGRGSAQFERTAAGASTLTVFGAIDASQGDAGFVLEGVHDRNGWHAESDGIRMAIDPAGEVTGGGVSGARRYTFSGRLAPERFDLQVDLEPLPEAGKPPPAASLFTFNYRLRRAVEGGGRDTGCREIRYEMRPVANIGDGSMSMLRVPVCVQ